MQQINQYNNKGNILSTNSNDFLLGGGSASARFDVVGDTVTGTITNQEVRQQTDIATGEPLVWANGDPRMQLLVTLQTALRDDDDDDGLRTLYVKGSKKAGSRSLHDAVASAVRAASSKGLEDGGTLTVKYVGDEPSQTRGFNPRKLYEATYQVAPIKAAASGAYLGTTVPNVTPAAPSPVEQQAAFAAWQASQNK